MGGGLAKARKNRERNPLRGADRASYHLSHFRSFAELQLEIGHRDATLLRTRYVDQRGVRNAKRFWAQSDQREDFVEA